ncbi:MAG: VOC family protein [Bacillota bacterium]
MAKLKGMISFFGAKDLETVSQFYLQIPGIELYKDQGKCLIFKVDGGGYLGFCRHLKETPGDQSPIITLLTEDKASVDRVFERFKEAMIETKESPELNREFGIYHFFLKDPTGYTLEIQTFI